MLKLKMPKPWLGDSKRCTNTNNAQFAYVNARSETRPSAKLKFLPQRRYDGLFEPEETELNQLLGLRAGPE